MKVLFLDIDGVCNCAFTPTRFKGFVGIDPPMADRVKRIIKETGCDVVLSSTWRLDAPFRQQVRMKVCNFIDSTPDLSYDLTDKTRGQEIEWWLFRHPEVTRCAIVDDATDFYDDQPLFKTKWETGLTDDIATAIIDYLKGGNREEV